MDWYVSFSSSEHYDEDTVWTGLTEAQAHELSRELYAIIREVGSDAVVTVCKSGNHADAIGYVTRLLHG